MLSRRIFFGGLFFFMVLMGGLSKPVFAHPHTFVNAGAQFVLSDGMLSEVRIDWVFDEMTTGALLGLASMEGDRSVDIAELNGMWGQALPAPHRLKDFVYIETSGNSVGIPAPSNVQLYLQNGQLRYMATFYVSQPANATKIWFLDASNYIAFTLNGNNIRCLGEGLPLGRNNISTKFFSTVKSFSMNIHILKISLLLCLAILIILAIPLFSDNYVDANPVAVQTGKTQTPPTQNWFLYQVTEGQKKLNKEITNNIRALKKEPKPAVFFGLLGIAFVYGALHAVGPGHGKMVITGWVVSQSRKFREIMMVSVLASFFHAFSSVTIVLATYYIMGKFVPGATEKLNQWLQLAAGVMLAVMGMHILWDFIRRRKNINAETAVTLEAAEQQPKVSISTHPFWIALSIGIVPCPLAAVILVFCLANKMLWQGIMIVSVFAAGMGASIFGIALSVWLLKSKAAEFALTQGKNRVLEGLSLLGGLFFIALGLLIALPYLSGSL